MAGRGGRGRGRGKNISFNVESLGFGRGDALPAPILEPGPTYPMAPFKPVPLLMSDDQCYLVTVKQELRTAMKDSPYYIKPSQKKSDIERYSDKYVSSQQEADKWEPDWKRLPAELQPKKKRKARTAFKVVPNIKKKKTVDISEQLKVLEEKEAQGDDPGEDDDEEDEEKKKEEDQEELEEDYDEEDLEEETDYNLTYFDNGENDVDDDDIDEGPTY